MKRLSIQVDADEATCGKCAFLGEVPGGPWCELLLDRVSQEFQRRPACLKAEREHTAMEAAHDKSVKA